MFDNYLQNEIDAHCQGHPFDNEQDYEAKVTYKDEEGEYYTLYATVEGIDIEVELQDPGLPDETSIQEQLCNAFDIACEPEYRGYQTPGGYTIY